MKKKRHKPKDKRDDYRPINVQFILKLESGKRRGRGNLPDRRDTTET